MGNQLRIADHDLHCFAAFDRVGADTGPDPWYLDYMGAPNRGRLRPLLSPALTCTYLVVVFSEAWPRVGCCTSSPQKQAHFAQAKGFVMARARYQAPSDRRLSHLMMSTFPMCA